MNRRDRPVADTWAVLFSSARAWLFLRTVHAAAASARQSLGAVVAALAAAALVLAGQWPALHDERAAQAQRIADLHAKLDAQRQALHRLRAEQVQLAEHSQQAQRSAPATVPAAMPSLAAAADLDAAPRQGAWRWQQLAQRAGLRLTQLPQSRDAGAAPLQLRLHGRYHQHGAWVAALAGETDAPHLLSYQLQSGEGGVHQAEVLLAPWPGAQVAGAVLPAATQAPPFAPATHRDPFSEPTAADALADVPPAWRAEFERPRQWLEGAALSELALVGTLRRSEHWLALLRWNGQVHAVRVGDYAGKDLGRVQRIDENGLWLREIVREASGRWQARERHWRVGEGS